MATLAKKEINIKSSAKIFPEYSMQTNFGDLGTGQTTVFDLKGIQTNNQIVKVLETGFDAVDNVFHTPIVDSRRKEQIHTDGTYGIDLYNKVFGGHQKHEAAVEYISELQNNSGATSSNYRAGIIYVVDGYDTMAKLANGAPLTARDTEAMNTLAAHPEVVINPYEAAKLGIGVPKDFSDFLRIHEVTECREFSTTRGLTLSSSEQDLVNLDVPNLGKEALVLERIDIYRPSQANGGQVQINIYRDNETNAVQTLDPACFEGPPTGTMSRMNFHFHAFENMHITLKATAGTYNNFKAVAYLSRRNVGIGFKAKLEEFLGPQGLPTQLDITSQERDIIDSRFLSEFSRSGLLGIG